MPKQIKGGTYYSLPEAAKILGVAHMTVFRWVTIPRLRKQADTHTGGIKVLRDSRSKHYYISRESVEKLVNRFQWV